MIKSSRLLIQSLFKKTKFYQSYVSGTSTEPLQYISVGHKLQQMAEKFPDQKCLISHHQNQVLTYSQFYQEVEKVAQALIALGLQPKDRVGIYSPNNQEWMVVQFAASLADLILVNINPAYQLSELKYSLNKVQCKCLFTIGNFKKSNYIQMLNELAPELKESNQNTNLNFQQLPHLKHIIRIDNIDTNGFINYNDLGNMINNKHKIELYDRLIKINPDDPTNIQYTSGTTGYPKACTLSHFNIINNGYFIGQRLRYSRDDIICLPVPLYHCFGMVLGNMAAINYGSTTIFPNDSFDAKKTLESVSKYGATSLYGVPTMFIEMFKEYEAHQNKYDVSTLKKGIMAGSICPEVLMEKTIKIFHMDEITICYGQTESSPVSFQTLINDSVENRCATVGKIHPHLEAKVIDPQTGLIVKRGEKGELCVRGYSVMKKYWDDEEQTRKTIDEDGWLHSGDLVVLSEDGYLRIVGRIKDMIIRGGENVYPREIEDFLLKMPNVEDVQVIGVEDEKFGEEVCAQIKLKDQSLKTNKLDVFNYCHGQIAHYKIPRYVKFVDSYPITISGKIQKNKMRDAFNQEIGYDLKAKDLYDVKKN